MVGGVRGQITAKASKKGEGGSAGHPHPMVCWLQGEVSFPGLSVLVPTPPPHPQSQAPMRGNLKECLLEYREILGTKASSELEPEKCSFSLLIKVTSIKIITIIIQLTIAAS